MNFLDAYLVRQLKSIVSKAADYSYYIFLFNQLILYTKMKNVSSLRSFPALPRIDRLLYKVYNLQIPV